MALVALEGQVGQGVLVALVVLGAQEDPEGPGVLSSLEWSVSSGDASLPSPSESCRFSHQGGGSTQPIGNGVRVTLAWDFHTNST